MRESFDEKKTRMAEIVEANHGKRIREAVKQAREKILNNAPTGSINDAVPDLSMPRPMRESFDEKKTRMAEIEPIYKYREEEKTRRARREEATKSVRE